MASLLMRSYTKIREPRHPPCTADVLQMWHVLNYGLGFGVYAVPKCSQPLEHQGVTAAAPVFRVWDHFWGLKPRTNRGS